MTGESAELEMVNIRVRRRAGAAPDMHPWPAGPRFRSSKGVLEKDLLYPGSACFGFHTVILAVNNMFTATGHLVNSACMA